MSETHGIGAGVPIKAKTLEVEPQPSGPGATGIEFSEASQRPILGGSQDERMKEALDLVGTALANLDELGAAVKARAEHAQQLEQAILQDRAALSALDARLTGLQRQIAQTNTRFGALDMAIKASGGAGQAEAVVKAARTFLAFVEGQEPDSPNTGNAGASARPQSVEESEPPGVPDGATSH
jgi:hypothetical protein